MAPASTGTTASSSAAVHGVSIVAVGVLVMVSVAGAWSHHYWHAAAHIRGMHAPNTPAGH